MPMQRARYPRNWAAVAAALKEAADWTCQECGLACCRPGQPFVSWHLMLTVAHVYPETHAPDAEVVCVQMLCAACHARFDADKQGQHSRRYHHRHQTSFSVGWARQAQNLLSPEELQELADLWPELPDDLGEGIDRLAEFGIYGEVESCS